MDLNCKAFIRRSQKNTAIVDGRLIINIEFDRLVETRDRAITLS